MSRVRREPSSNKKIYILIAVFVFILILLFGTAKGKYQLPISEKVTMTVLAPFQGIMNHVSSMVRQGTSAVWEIATVYQQNKMLQSEIEQLREMQVNIAEVTAENDRLRSMLGYKQAANQFDLVAAKVIARDPSNWTSTIVINKGQDDGIQKDMAVITPQGLVGNVVSVVKGSARVQLILDPRSSVGGLVQRAESRVAGIIAGDNKKQMMVRMINVPRDADIVEGDKIVTSGFGGIYPKGISIGDVESIVNDEGGLLKCAILKTTVDFQRLEEVSVIVTSRETPPEPLTQQPATVESDNASLTKSAGGSK
ncbi:rod shape-determining protein MreC [Anaerosinus massiliensis]|uniref:rod shape-determining protein MreC n=1 Tax=Massilibacillus massiliensis TaxID=1806837 RepID=UPI000A9C1FC9|nr:rod shape-determining protein MreC [Massilibacillus massiliensis]